ncbi:5-oxoprolinase/urea amidolyase family protein [Arthrobacter sp. JZ12]|nr:5-oxoprolinase/urea amidolyase family protein [Arthrobacter sp. JZ12]
MSGDLPGKVRDIRWAGTQALLVDLDSLNAVLALHSHLQERPLEGQVDVLAAAETVLVVFRSSAAARAARPVIAALDVAAPAIGAASADLVQIEVVYDGEDLTEVGRLTGLGVDGVIAAHTDQVWTAAFGGFAPGFAYMVGEHDGLNVPRRSTPRTAVPAGSVALAGNFSAVYPRRSPGGWQLIGRTAARLWDLHRSPPALLRPGMRVQYLAVRELIETSSAHLNKDDVGGPRGSAFPCSLEVLSPGPQSLLQDLGRLGLGDLGVSPSGAADLVSARQANRLVGNEPGDAVVEMVFGGLAVHTTGEVTAALTGASVSARITGPYGERSAPMCAGFALHTGEELHIPTPDAGLRTYLAVRGGFDVPPVLGSRATDLLSGIGPEPLSSGSVLPVGEVTRGHVVGEPEPSTLPAELVKDDGPVTLRFVRGPRDDWFTFNSLNTLTGQEWNVTAESNRVGLRLGLPIEDRAGKAQPLERVREGELPSEGVVAGALQVPPSGLPVLFLADHPVTGGYPVIGVVVPEDLPTAAQLRPGAAVRFAEVDPG